MAMLGSSCSPCCAKDEPCSVDSRPSSIKVAYTILNNKNGSYPPLDSFGTIVPGCVGFGASGGVLYLQTNAIGLVQGVFDSTCQHYPTETWQWWTAGAANNFCQAWVGASFNLARIAFVRTICNPPPAAGYRRQTSFVFPIRIGPVVITISQFCEYRLSSPATTVQVNALQSQFSIEGPSGTSGGVVQETRAEGVFGQTVNAGSFASTTTFPTLTWPITIYSKYRANDTTAELHFQLLGIFDQALDWVMMGPYGEKPSRLP